MIRLKEYKTEFVNVPGIIKPMCLRKNSTDYETLKYIFYDKVYQLDELAIKPKFIIDGGAYAGYSSVYFTTEYPKAQIIAVEPDLSSYELLKENVKSYKQIQVLNSGIWYKDTYLKLRNVGMGEWGMIVEETAKLEPGCFKAVTIASLMKTYKIDEIDILKLNIEGAEKELFSFGYEEWLDKVKILIIELHDRIKPGCSEAFFNAVKQYNFESFTRDWNIILYKKDCFRTKI